MFPTDTELAQNQRIEENYKLYKGEYNPVLRYLPPHKKNKLEVVMNLSGAISRIFADLTFLKPIRISHENEEIEKVLQKIAFNNDFNTMLWESALAQSYAGFTAFECRLENGKAIIEEISPSILYPQFNARNIKSEPSEIIVAYPVNINKQEYTFVKRHIPGKILYELYKSDKSNKLLSRADLSIYDETLPEEENTGLDYIPVWLVRNPKSGNETLGTSDYDDLRTLLKELSRVLSQVATQLEKFGDAKMAVPPGVLDENGKVRKEDMEMIEVAGNDSGLLIPQYITNANPQIDKAFTQIDAIMESIARISEVSSVLLDLNVNGGVEKVGALKLRMLRTLAKVERKRKSYDRQLRNMLSHAYFWETGKKIEPFEIDISFSDGLPEDLLDKITAETSRYTAGLQTKKDAIRNLDNLEGENLENKVKELEQDNMLDFNTVPNIAM